jgi:hypothetical protein
MIARLSLGQKQDDWLALAIADRVQLGIQSALGAPDAARGPPFFRRLAAVRCALR